MNASGTNRHHWQVLDTHFDQIAAGKSGLERLLCTWQAWQAEQSRPEQLFYTALVAHPFKPAALLQWLDALPADWASLARPWVAQWAGMLPGVHRLQLEDGSLCLTVCIGPRLEQLAGLDTAMNQIFWCEQATPAAELDFAEHAPKHLARLSQPGTQLELALGQPAARERLMAAGFQDAAPHAEGEPWLARYAPRWAVRSSLRQPSRRTHQPIVVVGGGLSGSAVAYSLAQRGCTVQVLDAAENPGAGASGLPVGLVAPHVSPDDSALSRITRAGVAATLPRLAQLLASGQDWAPSGVLEHRVEGKRGLPQSALWTGPDGPGMAWSRTATPEQTAAAQLPEGADALWHPRAAWLRPRALVQAQLAHPRIRWQGQTRVHTLQHSNGRWLVSGTHGPDAAPFCTETDTLVLCTAFDTLGLLKPAGYSLPLNALRGQVTWGQESDLTADARAMLPPFPVNGHGSFIHGMDFGSPGSPTGPCWVVGSTFERGATTPRIEPDDQIANRDRLARLLPTALSACGPAWASAQAWAGVRCTLPDRLPAVGSIAPNTAPGLMVCAGMGARGLTLSVLCGELVAAELFAEPWPLERKLALALLAQRFAQAKI